MIKIPYYGQEFFYSCFPACLKMILEFHKIRKSEKELRILCKTTPTFGTIWEIVENEIKSLGFEFIWKKDMRFEELEKLVKSNIPIIVSLDIEVKEVHRGHVAVVVDVTENSVVINDPEKGECLSMSKEQFLELWKTRKNLGGYLKKI